MSFFFFCGGIRTHTHARAALKAAANLPPMSLAVVELADQLLREVTFDIAEESLCDSSRKPCEPAVRELLEGATSSLRDDGKISGALHAVLSEEVKQTARAAKRSRELLAPVKALGDGYDIYGNRPKASSAETVVCPNCFVPIGADRFAQHLERCMLGRGRQRTAPQRSSPHG